MAGLQYSFFPTDFFYPRASPPATTSLVATNPKLEKIQKRDGLVVIDETRASLSLFIREKKTNQSQTWKKKPLWIEDDM
ncbi:unnamed protein product [Arabidopsis lyrata]|uniref:Uncharacterized protein n=1 Tax=Arabidopsis lyrata subsp. lyrata TaxID=81972 RepID=D7LVP2_ARALL|nr:hypothetical protein ARALYDRAFT_907174 [Arabidopsis lyrata subsp. lyrata]CAH8268900.1 unnamed protein product [Arabidopsis lyrata]